MCFVKVSPVSKAEFLAMGLAGVQVGYDYYTGKYNTLGGELYALKRAYQGAGVFNPKKLRELPVASLEILIDLLANFGFPEVTEEFLAGMKAELSEVIRNAKQPFDYSEIEGVAEYDAALVQARRKRTAAAAPAAAAAAPAAPAPAPAAAAAPVRVPTFNTWEDDPMETARRIWEWWRVCVWKVSVFKYWPLALRFVALVQTSSARIERVFLQLKFILEIIGYSASEKTVEARLFTLVNEGQYGH
jgi:subtilisin family serine protease